MNDQQFLNADGTPNIAELAVMYQRCGPVVAGGLAWLDNTRFCRWANQSVDGRKHDIKGKGKAGEAVPFDGASDCRPFVVDDIINEQVGLLTTSFWHARNQPGSAADDNGAFADALLQYLVWTLLFNDLTREVELSAQYVQHYGWTVLAPRWRREIGMRKKTISLAAIQQAAQQAQAHQDAVTQQGGDISQLDPTLLALAKLPTMIADPTQEAGAVDFLLKWYDMYVEQSVPADMQDRIPPVKKSTALKAVRALREEGTATVPIAYLAKNQPEICALKPWDEVFIAPELTNENEIVFQVERLHESELRSRIITDTYNPLWVDKAVKYKGAITAAPMEIRATPLGIAGLSGGATQSPVFSAQPTLNNTLIEIIHAVYRATDDDGIPTIYCTTYHKMVTDDYAVHDEVEGCGSDLPYAAGSRENWCRSITSSRGVPEKAFTHQNIIKGLLDSVIDRASITGMPPLNVYESPTGTAYRFGPAVQNYVRPGKEPAFMTPPQGQGMEESMEVIKVVKSIVDNSYGMMSEDVPAPRLQMMQGSSVQRFMMMWNKALKQTMALCRIHMDDADFAQITGAPAGWLEAHREDTDAFTSALMFDVRELDSELEMKRIETMNNLALPADVMGTINRAAWASDMVRAILGPLAAKRLVQPLPDASQALMDKANLEVLKMFAGNQPNIIDKMDPTAAGLLQNVQTIVAQNPTYLRALTDEALAALGPQVIQAAQQLQGGGQPGQPPAQRNSDPRFSQMLITYVKNLQFNGVTQPQNQQIGRTGVKPTNMAMPPPQMQIRQQEAPPTMINQP